MKFDNINKKIKKYCLLDYEMNRRVQFFFFDTQWWNFG